MRGEIAGQAIETTVDSEWAARIVEAGDLSSLGGVGPASLTATGLAALSQRTSVDAATLFFVLSLYADPTHRAAQDAFHRRGARLGGSGTAVASLPAELSSYLLAFVPGYGYRTNPASGADFARQRTMLEAAGVEARLIETDEHGGVEENARIVADTLGRWSLEPKPIIIVSTSKGGPEAALALGELMPPKASAEIDAWISIGGLLRGSPRAERMLRGARRWFTHFALRWRGLPTDLLESLRPDVRRPIFEQLRFPATLRTVQYVGAPLSGQVSPDVRGRYEALRPLGPNDGLTLLADELVPNGIVVTELGLDHYYRHPDIDLKTLALASLVAVDLQQTAESEPGQAARHCPSTENHRLIGVNQPCTTYALRGG